MERTTYRGQRGQSTAEYVGVVAFAGLLVAGLIAVCAPLVGPRATAAVEAAYCTIATTVAGSGALSCTEAGGGQPGRPQGDVPWYLDPGLSPVEAATAGEYVALGDSFSSGEGGSSYDPATNNDENRCHRSPGAYGPLIGSHYEFAGGFTFAACSGAVTDDFYSDNQGEPPQLDHLDEDTSLVTLTIGGNDAEFADTLSGCIAAGLNPFALCADGADEQAAFEANIQQALDNLEELLPEIREAAPNATILVLGYPQFFPDDPGSAWGDGTQIDTDDIHYINGAVADMNDGIADLIDDSNAQSGRPDFSYVDIEDAFEGCHIGTANPCMNNIDVGWTGGQVDHAGSYHPNDVGHQQIAEIVQEAIENGA